jgi:ABC-type phosphate/phosphonate transport system substrate-binding protein
MPRAIACLLLIVAALAPSTLRAAGEATGLLVCYPNAPGTQEQAQPVMVKLGEHLSAATTDTVRPAFFTAAAPAREWVAKERPRFAILSLALYLQWKDELKLELLAQSERGRARTERFHLIVPAASPWKTLDDLKKADGGRKPVIWSSHLDDPRFVGQVVFDGALRVASDEQGDVVGRSTAQPLTALRHMKSGKPFQDAPVDAVLLEDAAWSELQKLATFKEAVRALHSSAPLPTPPVVALPGADAPARERMKKALLGMDEQAPGRELLATLQVTDFLEPDAAAYEAVARAYAREAP